MSGSGTENKQCADLLSLSVTSLTYTKAIISSLMGWAARDADKSVLPFRNPFLSHFNTTEQDMITNVHFLLHFSENTLLKSFITTIHTLQYS